MYTKPYWEKEKYVFKAGEVPQHVSEKLLDKLQREEEEKRKERVMNRMEELKELSSLPPRMAKHEQDRIARRMRIGSDGEEEEQLMKDAKYFTHTF